MITQGTINFYLSKNISYLFSIGIFNSPLKSVLKDYVIDTYLYYPAEDSKDYLYVLLHGGCEELIEENSKDIMGYKDYFAIDNYIVIKLKLSSYLDEHAVKCLETSNFSALKKNVLYKKYVINQNRIDLQKQIIEETDTLLEELSIRFNSQVYSHWKRFNAEKETLDFDKLRDMDKELKIRKGWLQSKIENADILSKIAYEDVLNNSTEITAPSINSLIVKELNNFEDIFKKLQDKVKEKCGKANYQVVYTGGNQYPLMCNLVDFKSKLNKVIKKYKLEDINKIEKILIDHVANLRPGMQLLKYFIEKDNMSTLAGIYENYEERKEIVTKIDTKTVF